MAAIHIVVPEKLKIAETLYRESSFLLPEFTLFITFSSEKKSFNEHLNAKHAKNGFSKKLWSKKVNKQLISLKCYCI